MRCCSDDQRNAAWSTPTKTVIHLNSPEMPSRVVVFNSHARERKELISLKVSQPNVKVCGKYYLYYGTVILNIFKGILQEDN